MKAGSGAINPSGVFDVLAVWAVGTAPTVYPEGTGRWVRKGQTLRTNLHYHPNGKAQVDRTRVGLYFGKGELKKEVAAPPTSPTRTSTSSHASRTCTCAAPTWR